jgi:hypothetical protein
VKDEHLLPIGSEWTVEDTTGKLYPLKVESRPSCTDPQPRPILNLGKAGVPKPANGYKYAKLEVDKENHRIYWLYTTLDNVEIPEDVIYRHSKGNIRVPSDETLRKRLERLIERESNPHKGTVRNERKQPSAPPDLMHTRLLNTTDTYATSHGVWSQPMDTKGLADRMYWRLVPGENAVPLFVIEWKVKNDLLRQDQIEQHFALKSKFPNLPFYPVQAKTEEDGLNWFTHTLETLGL